MGYRQQLEQLIKEEKGMILTKDVTLRGIPREYVSIFVEEGILQKIDRSCYITKDGIDDVFYRYQGIHDGIIYSHRTALYLLGVIDTLEDTISITALAGYHSTTLDGSGLIIHHVKRDTYELGITWADTIANRKVKVYNIERTICDLLRDKQGLDNKAIISALQYYTGDTNNNISKLLEYADIFKVKKKLELYLSIVEAGIS